MSLIRTIKRASYHSELDLGENNRTSLHYQPTGNWLATAVSLATASYPSCSNESRTSQSMSGIGLLHVSVVTEDIAPFQERKGETRGLIDSSVIRLTLFVVAAPPTSVGRWETPAVEKVVPQKQFPV